MLVALLLVTVDFRDAGPLGTVQHGVQTVFAPIQAGFERVVSPIAGVFTTIRDLGRLREENAALREEIDRLNTGRVSLADLQRQNAELRDLLGMTQRLEFEVTAARVIAGPPSPVEYTVILDAGAGAGIEQNMAVVNAQGLVGIVIEVTARRSRVLLATSPDAGFAARIAQTGDRGFLSGRTSDPLRLELLATDADIPLGAEVVTQAYQGTMIPDGLPVGVLVDPPGRTFAGQRFLQVRPYVDFDDLSTVAVVLNAPSEPVELSPTISNEDAPRPPAAQPPTAVDPAQPAGAPTAGAGVAGSGG